MLAPELSQVPTEGREALSTLRCSPLLMLIATMSERKLNLLMLLDCPAPKRLGRKKQYRCCGRGFQQRYQLQQELWLRTTQGAKKSSSPTPIESNEVESDRVKVVHHPVVALDSEMVKMKSGEQARALCCVSGG